MSLQSFSVAGRLWAIGPWIDRHKVDRELHPGDVSSWYSPTFDAYILVFAPLYYPFLFSMGRMYELILTTGI